MNLGEWDDDAPVYDLDDAPQTDEQPVAMSGHVAAALEGLDVSALVSATVAKQVRAQVAHEVAPIVAEAVAAVLTPERLDAVREAAAKAAEAELAPAPHPVDAELEPATGDAPPVLYYRNVDEFVREFVCPVFSRTVGERSEYRWSARWWESAEAITRLEAMWRAWEHLRLDPATGTSVWLRDHADHHLGVLMSPSGPFAKSADTARLGEPLPYEAPPQGLFADMRTGSKA